MKIPILLPPAVALVISGAWLGTQRNSISNLVLENAVLRNAIASHSSGVSVDAPGPEASPSRKVARSAQPPDWEKVAAMILETREGGMSDMRERMRFQQRLQEMTEQELLDAFDRIAALDLTEDARETLEQMLLEPLCLKNPELALTRFSDRIADKNGLFGWTLSSALTTWANKEPAKANAWLDARVDDGVFESKSLDGRNQARFMFEAALISSLLGPDPDAAGLRLDAIPEKQRKDVLSQFQFRPLKKENQVAYAALVRGHLPEEDRNRSFGQFASRLASQADYEEVTGFMERIQATPAERASCVAEAAESKLQTLSHQKKITAENIDAMREWAAVQAPGTADKITGTALGNSVGNNRRMSFDDAAALAVEYNGKTGNDEVLVSFLESRGARQNKEKSRALAGSIADAKSRERILDRLK